MVESGVVIARCQIIPDGDLMYVTPILERFGTLRQLTAAPFAALSLSMAQAGGPLPVDCGPNVPLGDPSACGRS
jgi:hypothetical protein